MYLLQSLESGNKPSSIQTNLSLSLKTFFGESDVVNSLASGVSDAGTRRVKEKEETY